MRRFTMVLVCLGSAAGIASADGTKVATATDPAATPPSPTSTSATAPAVVAAPEEGATLRNGFSASLGEEYGSGPSSGLSAALYGIDWRIGAKLSEQLAIYADTHLSMGTAKIGAFGGTTSNFAAALIGEYTLPMRVFVGAGGGYGVLNNPSGPLAQVRAGWYPMAHTGAGKERRLNIALDGRFYFAGDLIGTVSQISLTLGYDRF